MPSSNLFDLNCKQCLRLDQFLCSVKQQYPTYHARPVPAFGDQDAKLLIVGLAPGMHGANASGRPFTGDYAGLLLYETLYEFGFSNQATSESITDHLKLTHCRITNAVKCLPPNNKPTVEEIKQCNSYLAAELQTLQAKSVILALGVVAHQAILKALTLKQSNYKFNHHAIHNLPNSMTLIDSFHTSRYNIQTKRLNKTMFSDIFVTVTRLLNQP